MDVLRFRYAIDWRDWSIPENNWRHTAYCLHAPIMLMWDTLREMDKRLQARYAKANTERTATRPADMLADAIGWVPRSGFRWVEGYDRHGRKGLFLDPLSDTGVIRRVQLKQASEGELCGGAFLKFSSAPLTPSGMLSIANEYGRLGIPRVHFHSNQTDATYAESINGWLANVERFQVSFRMFEHLQSSDADALARQMRSMHVAVIPIDDAPVGVLALAAKMLTSAVNSNVGAGIHYRAFADEPCHHPGCQSSGGSRPTVTPHVSYQVVESDHGSFRAKLQPTCLLSAVWLQFAELVCGAKKIRRCDICQEWMDVSLSARPNAKKMHAQCSRAERMRRWRGRI